MCDWAGAPVPAALADADRLMAYGVRFRESGVRSSRPSCVRAERAEVYAERVTKRTNINLDVDLLDRAAAVLGTRRTTDTVHAALQQVVAQALRRRLAAHDFPDLTPETLEELRRSRSVSST